MHALASPLSTGHYTKLTCRYSLEWAVIS